MKKIIFFACLSFLLLLAGCGKDNTELSKSVDEPIITPPVQEPKVNFLLTIDDIFAYGASISANYSTDAQYTEKGIIIWKNGDEKKKIAIDFGSSKITVNDLTHDTDYNVCAYLIINNKEYLSEQKKFKTSKEAKVIVEDLKIKDIGLNYVELDFVISEEYNTKVNEWGFYVGQTESDIITPGNLHVAFKGEGVMNKSKSHFMKYDSLFKSPVEQYYVCAYVCNPTGSFYSKTQKIRCLTDLGSEMNKVDLGLPSGTLWAECNVGAKKMTDFGNYFTWGEIEDTKDAYKYFIPSGSYVDDSGVTVYTQESYVDLGVDISGTQYDAPYMIWGGKWRIPSSEDFSELHNNTTRQYIEINGVEGIRFTASNGKSLFFPFGGHYNRKTSDDTIIKHLGHGYYWGSDIPSGTGTSKTAFDCCYYNPDMLGTHVMGIERYFANNIRAIWK